MAALLRTPLHGLHQELGGQLVPFAGYEMPVRYTSIQEEHMAVRTAAGLFDVSHMSNLWVRGQRAGEALAKVTVANAPAIPQFGTKYTTLLRDDGTIIDDLYIYRLPEAYHIVPNAGMNTEVARWIVDKTKADVQDKTAGTCIFALQGPRAAEILQKVTDIDLKNIKRFRCALGAIGDVWTMVSRTGYTGEDGFELFPEAKYGEEMFRSLLEVGRGLGLKPCGLGARDTLRLEKGFCLAGHEFVGGRSPLEASLDRFVNWDHDFIGRAALLAQKEKTHQRLVGLEVQDKGIPRQDCEVHAGGRKVGVVTSGTLSPMLKKGIAMAYVDAPHHNAGTKLDIMIRGAPSPAVVVDMPFVR